MIVGGNTLFPNIAERLSSNINKLGGNSIDFKIIAPAERQFAPWIGGSILSCLSPFDKMWVTREEYEDNPDIVNVKYI